MNRKDDMIKEKTQHSVASISTPIWKAWKQLEEIKSLSDMDSFSVTWRNLKCWVLCPNEHFFVKEEVTRSGLVCYLQTTKWKKTSDLCQWTKNSGETSKGHIFSSGVTRAQNKCKMWVSWTYCCLEFSKEKCCYWKLKYIFSFGWRNKKWNIWMRLSKNRKVNQARIRKKKGKLA